ncbi:hypothetical protein MP638_002221 [Amoeboaphelidium occidentale]|nr:hypothetical protein MP638_002221 [Amoeboaphelidium occidentale]
MKQGKSVVPSVTTTTTTSVVKSAVVRNPSTTTTTTTTAATTTATATSIPADDLKFINGALFPIQSLNPYQNKWTIKAFCLKKSDMRQWSNAKGEGKLFSVTLCDESGEIKATAFNDVAERLFSVFQEGQVYYLSRAQVKIARKQYASNVQNEYEISMDSSTEVNPCLSQSGGGGGSGSGNNNQQPSSMLMQYQKFNFVSGIDALLNEYEISMDSSTEVNPCLSQSGGSGGSGNNNQQPSSMLMQYQKFNFVSGIDALLVKEKDSIVDLIGVLRSQGELVSFVSKASQRQMQKRELVLVDQSMYQVKLTLFGKQAETFDQNATQGSVLVLKSCKVSEYNGGKSLTLLSSGSMFVNPDIQQAHLLRGWYESEGSMQNFTSLDGTGGALGGGVGGMDAAAAGLRNYGCLQDIQEKNLGLRDKPDYLNLCGTVTFLKGDKTMYYMACPGENCNKKVTEDMGQYRCEKCQRVYNYCDYRYIFSFQLTDYSSSSWVQCFNEAGETMLGMPAEELHRLKESQQDEEKYQSVFEKVAYKRFKFTIKIKQENYQDEVKVKSSVFQIENIDYAQESQVLLKLVEQMS